MKRITQNIFCLVLLIAVMLQIQGCRKEQEVGVNPYAGGKEPLGIVFTKAKASPESGRPGEIVTLNVRGLLKHDTKFKLYLNKVEVEVSNLTETTVDIKIPAEVSSGMVTVVLDNQIFYGPFVGVEGKARVDTDFKIVNGFNSSIAQILAHSGGFLVTGYFTDFENQATNTNSISSIHFLNSLGQTSNAMNFGHRAIGGINAIEKLSNGQFIIGGSLTAYNKRSVGGLTRLLANGSLDTMIVSVINPEPEKKPLDGFDTVSTFNGRLYGSITNIFTAEDNSVIAVGGFSYHSKIDYNYSSRENRRYITTRVNNIAKLKFDGSLDSSFNINNVGFNGFVTQAVKLNDGRIVAVGRFTSYNGKAAKNIVCIKPNGSIDETFAVGGSDEAILSITYNSVVDKIVVAGNFKKFAGQAVKGVAIINGDGTIDPTFKFGTLDDEGAASYAYVLNNGRVFVQGMFLAYNGTPRNGMLILEPNGIAKQEYNNLGGFTGQVNTLLETTSSIGNPAILLGGFIFSVDGKSVGNIVKIELNN